VVVDVAAVVRDMVVAPLVQVQQRIVEDFAEEVDIVVVVGGTWAVAEADIVVVEAQVLRSPWHIAAVAEDEAQSVVEARIVAVEDVVGNSLAEQVAVVMVAACTPRQVVVQAVVTFKLCRCSSLLACVFPSTRKKICAS